MPQIAIQDYNVVAPQYAENVERDAAALGVLAGHLERGTIFDVLIENATDNPDGITRVAAVKGKSIFIVSPMNGPINIDVDYTPLQYEGLAAVQVACELTERLPILEKISGYITESLAETFLCVDGKLVSVTEDNDNKVASLSVSDEQPGDDDSWVNVPFDELQKLIGVDLD